ncbi:MAG TPA: DUF4185 domain-containing protein [Pirellulales bacterium]|nr:DUF4185 domain-containing protein [Pirellulales bacterium]
MPKLNACFRRERGWVGGDGDYSTPLSDQKTAWIFSDTLVGEMKNGARHDVAFVNNTVAIQTGHWPDAKFEFFVAKNSSEKPVALFVPKTPGDWFWPQAAVEVRGHLLVFLSRIQKSGGGGAFGFKQVGRTLAIVSNPLDSPLDWKFTQVELTDSIIRRERESALGGAILKQEDFVYFYGTDDVRRPGGGKFLIVARSPSMTAEDPTTWKYYRDGDWDATAEQAEHLCPGLANEFSVSWLPAAKRFALVYTENGLSDKILVRTAEQPSGPWSEATTVYRAPEATWDKRIFCYAAKAHPELAGPDELVISYVANSHELKQTIEDGRLYWPMFVRVKLAK